MLGAGVWCLGIGGFRGVWGLWGYGFRIRGFVGGGCSGALFFGFMVWGVLRFGFEAFEDLNFLNSGFWVNSIGCWCV